MKKAVCWLGYAVLIIGGAAVSLGRLLPVQNTCIFVMGLYWTWTGLMLLLNLGEYGELYKRSAACRLVHGVICLAMGAAWVPLSLTPLSNRGMPVFLCSAPFVLLVLLTARLYRKERPKKEEE